MKRLTMQNVLNLTTIGPNLIFFSKLILESFFFYNFFGINFGWDCLWPYCININY